MKGPILALCFVWAVMALAFLVGAGWALISERTELRNNRRDGHAK